MQQKLQWQKKGRRQILETKVMTVTEIDSVSPRGDTGTYIVMDAPDWVIVIPILKNPDRFLMVKQWRHGTQSLSTEFPGGVMDAGETPEHFQNRIEEWETRLRKTENIGEVIIGKQRHGPTGTVQLFWNGEFAQFGNLAKDEYLPEQARD